ncbi:SGNH/GDSL hydrolase family protein [Marinilactibacillus psychrotolerans]|uniref:Esterase n=1 Tax=Marinilactibacillus psychrotolerans TaxID=191770 RepID=A0AAV3WYB6_9LACT|nr:SGNH/GDSL hydrolase family protein [Marinilactibacillus psychrotolerans]GEL68023.1 lipase [Marinilactibacillus psychrotolerans]GEQ36672.1 esterase [Marinilactibacillus psychrotolerans]SDD34095.1 Lysophospholipase L1 [Marinilactibacillus psychrotolerans]
MKIRQNDKILFIGDSITDAGRDRSNKMNLGQGYPLLVAAELQAFFPEKKLTFYNTGISGDRLIDLKNRWEKDCLDINPDVVSLLIGINDTSHQISKSEETDLKEIEKFEEDYRFLLKSLSQRTDARVVLMEPFVLPYPKERMNWRRELDPRIQIVRKVARDYQTDLIPLDGLFNSAGISDGYSYYTGDDGVHPTVAGHGLIKKAWLECLKE